MKKVAILLFNDGAEIKGSWSALAKTVEEATQIIASHSGENEVLVCDLDDESNKHDFIKWLDKAGYNILDA